MEINYIREFLRLLESGNYLDAAEELFTSSASLARHIKKLEDELGFRLFQPQGRSIVLSPAAKSFLPIAEELVRLQERSFHLSTSPEQDDHQTLRVGVPAVEEPAYGLQALIARFREESAPAEVRIVEDETKALFNRLFSFELDFLIAYLPPLYQESTAHFVIIPDQLAVFVPATDPLAQKAVLHWEDLQGKTIVPRPRHTFLREHADEVLEKKGIAYKASFDPAGTANLLTVVAGELGLSLMPKAPAEYLMSISGKSQEVCVRALELPEDLSIHLVYLPGRDFTPQGKRFIRYMQDNKV